MIKGLSSSNSHCKTRRSFATCPRNPRLYLRRLLSYSRSRRTGLRPRVFQRLAEFPEKWAARSRSRAPYKNRVPNEIYHKSRTMSRLATCAKTKDSESDERRRSYNIWIKQDIVLRAQTQAAAARSVDCRDQTLASPLRIRQPTLITDWRMKGMATGASLARSPRAP